MIMAEDVGARVFGGQYQATAYARIKWLTVPIQYTPAAARLPNPLYLPQMQREKREAPCLGTTLNPRFLIWQAVVVLCRGRVFPVFIAVRRFRMPCRSSSAHERSLTVQSSQ